MTYGIIGVGALGAAIVTGLCEGVKDAPRIVLSPRNARRAADLASRFPTVRVAESNQAVIDGASVVLLCIRPQEARSVLPGLRFSSERAIVSMMAGVSIEELQALGAPARNVARAIPLPAVATRPRPRRPRFPLTSPISTPSAAGSSRRASPKRPPDVRLPPLSRDWRHCFTIRRRTSMSLRAITPREAGPTNSSSACCNRHACSTSSAPGWIASSSG